jgi:hypothetical protein
MVPRTADNASALPESIPNPSIRHDALPNGGNSNGSGYNKLKLRVPMERRYVCKIPIPNLCHSLRLISFSIVDITLTQVISNGHPRYTITTSSSQSCWRPSRPATIPPSPPLRRVCWNGSAPWARGIYVLTFRAGLIGFTCRVSVFVSLLVNVSRLLRACFSCKSLYGFLIDRVLSPLSPRIDVALNTQKCNEDYVGIICTKAVSSIYYHLVK